MKYCHTCQRELPESEFHKRTYKSGKVALQSKCKSCSTSMRRTYWKPHEVARRRHKMSDEEYNTLIERCQGKCEVCSRPLTKVCIDHDHTTNKVRGVLCHNCNTALGLVGDRTEVLSKLIQYLERPGLQE